MHFHRICLFLIAVLVPSCIFESDDENYKVVDPTATITPIQIDLELQDDTVDVFGQTFFKYDIKGFEPARNYIITFFTEKVAGTPWLSEFKGEIEYHPEIDSGYVKATLRVETRSGTNSLADQLGLEKIVFERSWILNIYTKLPREPKITSIGRENGSLKVSWEKYDKINFHSYMVIRIKGSKYTVEKTIADPDSSFYFDNAYVGGEVMYSVVTKVKGGGFSSGPFETYNDENVATLVKYERADNNNTKISWSASRYPDNVGRYDIYEGIFPNSTGDLIYSTTNPLDTVFAFLSRFGKPAYIKVFTYSKLNNPDPEFVSSNDMEYLNGEKIEPYENIFFAATKNRYFTRDKNFINAYSLNNELINKVEIPAPMNLFSVTKNERELIGVYENKLYSWDAVTLQLNYVQDLSPLLGDNQIVTGIGATIDNKVLLCKSPNGSMNGNLIIYDPDLQTIENEYTGLPAETILELSPSGTYVMGRGYSSYTRILKLRNDNTLQSIFTALSSDKVFFNPSNEGQVIIGSSFSHPDGTVYIQDIETWQLVERIHTPPLITYDMNPQSGYIVGRLDDGTGILQVYDYKNQKELFRAALGSSPFLTIQHGYLYSREGARIKIDE